MLPFWAEKSSRICCRYRALEWLQSLKSFSAAATAQGGGAGGTEAEVTEKISRHESRGGRGTRRDLRQRNIPGDDSNRFEPIQGLAAKKFTPSNKSVMSLVKDLTNGLAAKTIFRNAMLSMETKRKIGELHASDPQKYSSIELAKKFKV